MIKNGRQLRCRGFAEVHTFRRSKEKRTSGNVRSSPLSEKDPLRRKGSPFGSLPLALEHVPETFRLRKGRKLSEGKIGRSCEEDTSAEVAGIGSGGARRPEKVSRRREREIYFPPRNIPGRKSTFEEFDTPLNKLIIVSGVIDGSITRIRIN